MELMTKEAIKLQLANQFLKDDTEEVSKPLDSELTLLRRYNAWLLDQLAAKYYGKVSAGGEEILRARHLSNKLEQIKQKPIERLE